MPKLREQLDLHLLRVLQSLLKEHSVSRTAIRLGMSQPAVSNALRRLREITGDPILLRGKKGMVPTERGPFLLAHATEALQAIERLSASAEPMDPSQSTRVFNLGAPDYLDGAFIPDIAERVRRQAPQARLVVHTINPDLDYVQALEEGELDVVIGNWLEPPEKLHLARLFDDEVVCMLGRHHPLAQRGLSLQHYLDMPHLAPSAHVTDKRGFIDGCLAEQGISRQVQMVVPYFGLVPGILSRTDMVFTTNRQFAEYYARILPITVLPCPVHFPLMRFYQLWHPRTHNAAELLWFRRCIAQAAGRLDGLSEGTP
ncbi:LysR family transcriptional regulator [Alcaligenes faecalis]|uniref:LysR family transcriptional regulator n=1 Tax=Alcaligenes faecalis TaxID=511 RepID=UPI002932CC58|nr:LysR family transcriptional regulator [Alcaligenes faecalis]MDV2116051.1 LysR family transcriptional regulator [Alcaligenes faecalis]